MASEATPRINARYLDSFTNQTVRILGKVVSLRGETATIDANGTINVLLNRVYTCLISLTVHLHSSLCFCTFFSRSSKNLDFLEDFVDPTAPDKNLYAQLHLSNHKTSALFFVQRLAICLKTHVSLLFHFDDQSFWFR